MRIPIWIRRNNSDGTTELRAANVPESKWRCALERIPASMPYRQAIVSYIGPPDMQALRENVEAGRGLLLYGPYRAGKSAIAAIILREVALHQCDPHWLESFDLADASEERGEEYRRFRGTVLAVLDDLGTEGAHPYRRELIERVLRYRLERCRTTILTTNMKPEGIEPVYGPKLVALLHEFVTPVFIQGMNWASPENDQEEQRA